MIEQDTFNTVPAHVQAWRNASSEEYIVWEPDGEYHYESERGNLVELWHTMTWQIKVGDALISGKLWMFEDGIYITDAGNEPEFEIGFDDESGKKAYLRGYFGSFAPVTLLTDNNGRDTKTRS